MNQNKIEELKAKIAAQVQANMVAIKERAEIATLEAQLKLETSETLLAAKVKQQASAEQTAKLERLVQECEQIITSIPVLNPKTRSNRVWAGNRKVAYGSQINLMYQLATGILYSCADHKAMLIEHTGLNSQLLEEVVEAFGTPTYYSRNFHTIVKPKPYDVERVKGSIDVMQSTLGVAVDTSALTENNFEQEFQKAVTTAQLAYDAAVEALEEADFEV